jgi:hypothetical protein
MVGNGGEMCKPLNSKQESTRIACVKMRHWYNRLVKRVLAEGRTGSCAALVLVVVIAIVAVASINYRMVPRSLPA